MSLLIKVIGFILRKRKNSWIFSAVFMFALRFLKSLFTKKEIVDLSSSKPGDKFVVEHLPISHAKQIKQFKKEKKAAKKNKKKRSLFFRGAS